MSWLSEILKGAAVDVLAKDLGKALIKGTALQVLSKLKTHELIELYDVIEVIIEKRSQEAEDKIFPGKP